MVVTTQICRSGCYFFDRVPRELRNACYAFAHADGSALHCTGTTRMITIPESKDKVPVAIAKKLHVNKRYFKEALPILTQKAEFHFDATLILQRLTGLSRIIPANMTTISILHDVTVDGFPLATVGIINTCPRIRHVVIRIDPCSHYHNLAGIVEVVHRASNNFSDLDFRLLLDIFRYSVYETRKLRGLESFTIRGNKSSERYRPAVDKHLEMLAEEIRPYVIDN